MNDDLRKWRFDLPWIGPRLHKFPPNIVGNQAANNVFALSSPKYGLGLLLVIPVCKSNVSRNIFLKCEMDVSGSGFVNDADVANYLNPSSQSSSANWLSKTVSDLGNNANVIGWLTIVAYTEEQTTLETWSDSIGVTRANADGNKTTWQHYFTYVNPTLQNAERLNLLRKLDRWIVQTQVDLSTCFISRTAISAMTSEPKDAFNFVLASCQYPSGFVDKKLAFASLQAMANNFDALKENLNLPFDFVVFAGDQIYADSSAGLLDPTRSDERLDLPYEVAFRAEPMRQLMREVPIHMLLDDHEITNNYEPMHAKYTGGAEAKQKKMLAEGLEAYWKYQRLKPVAYQLNDSRETRYQKICAEEVSYSFAHGRAKFYMLDTRSKRKFRKIGKLDSANLWPPSQSATQTRAAVDGELESLCKWLIENKNDLKFIISPSILLPRKLDALNKGKDHATRTDSWEGYPANLQVIFNTLIDHGVKNTVFLSGDEHLSCHATATMSKHGLTAKIVSIHSSGLYAPFPFANAKEEDFISGTDVFQSGKIICVNESSFAPLHTRFAKIKVDKDGSGNLTVFVEYHGVNGVLDTTPNLL